MRRQLGPWGGNPDGTVPNEWTWIPVSSGTLTIQSGLLRVSSSSTAFSGGTAEHRWATSNCAPWQGEFGGRFAMSRATANVAMLLWIRGDFISGTMTQTGAAQNCWWWSSYAGTLNRSVLGTPAGLVSSGVLATTTPQRFRFRSIGPRFFFKVWDDGTAEPDWLLDYVDATPTAAETHQVFVGMGIQVQDTTTSYIDFSELYYDDLIGDDD